MPFRWYGPSIVLLLTVAAVMVIAPRLTRQIVWSAADARITQVRQDLADDDGLAALSRSFSEVSEAVEPSVVHVQTYGESARRGGLFSRFDPPTRLGNGSGWVYQHQPRDGGEPRNYILTNHHVVDGASRIRVRFADGSEYTASLINSDPPTDVAVLEVPEALLHPAAIAPQPVKKGQIVFAFGSPFRFDFSVSQGIVSASGRRLDISNTTKYEDFIQTDAAINPGNSGGPLTDIFGRVVGMNTAIASSRSGPDDPGGFMGLGFAIPVAMAVDVATRILDDGQVKRGYLGVYINPLTPEMADALNTPDDHGVLIEHPLEGGSADRAGLEPGDVVVQIQDQTITDAESLRSTVADFDPGRDISVGFIRDGQRRDVTVTLDELPPPRPRSLRRWDFLPQATQTLPELRAAGIGRLGDYSETDARRLGLPPRPGVLIADVRPGSIADAQRLQETAIITHLDRRRVADLSQLRAALEQADPWSPLLLQTVYWDFDLEQYINRFAVLDIHAQP